MDLAAHRPPEDLPPGLLRLHDLAKITAALAERAGEVGLPLASADLHRAALRLESSKKIGTEEIPGIDDAGETAREMLAEARTPERLCRGGRDERIAIERHEVAVASADFAETAAHAA